MNTAYKHWNIGMVYRDHKRQLDCILVGITDYKHKSGAYLDFRYLDSSKYIRQAASKALSRFEATGTVLEVDTSEVPHFDTGTDYMPAKNITSQIETIVLERYANVIYIDFIKKCRIY